MGYLNAWKRNLAALIVILAAIGAFIGVVAWAHGKQFKSGPGQNAKRVRLSVTGSAPGGVAVNYLDQAGTVQVTRHTIPPFTASALIDGRPAKSGPREYFAEFAVTPLNGGSISCTIRIGSAVKVSHSTGRNTCDVSLSYDTRSGTWY